jgi:hypothetical protein
MRGALRSEAQHPVRCDRITIGGRLETRLIWSVNESQSPAIRTLKSPSYSPVGKICKTPRSQGRPAHEECAK